MDHLANNGCLKRKFKMKTKEEYELILAEAIKTVEEKFPNWRLIPHEFKYPKVFCRSLPPDLNVEDICIICSILNKTMITDTEESIYKQPEKPC